MDVERLLRRNAVHARGHDGMAMVFAHGLGCDQQMWRHVAPSFELTHRVVLFDHVGSGNSDLSAYDPVKYAQLDGYASDLLEICHALDLRHCIYVGHSVATMIGVLAAIRAPELFSRLILVAPSPCYINEDGYTGGFDREGIEEMLVFLDSNYFGWSNAMGRAIMGRDDRPEFGDELAASLCRADPEIARQFARVTFLSDLRAELPKLRVPSLIMQCADDIVAPLEVGEYMNRHMPGSALVRMKAAGHCPHLSAPAETIAVMKDYLNL